MPLYHQQLRHYYVYDRENFEALDVPFAIGITTVGAGILLWVSAFMVGYLKLFTASPTVASLEGLLYDGGTITITGGLGVAMWSVPFAYAYASIRKAMVKKRHCGIKNMSKDEAKKQAALLLLPDNTKNQKNK